MSVRPQIRELAPYSFTHHPRGVKLDQNELPADLPQPLREELLARIAEVAFNRYPRLQPDRLRERLAEIHDWPVEGVVVGPGSNVLIQCFVIAAGIGQGVLTPTPTFGVYRLQSKLLGAPLTEVPLGPNFELPVAGLAEAMTKGSGVLFVPNPAAPTGNLHPRADIEALAEAAAPGWTFVIDEAYREFAGSDFKDVARRSHVATLRTFSKAFGLAGARVGYALMQPELAQHVAKTINPFAVSELQEAAALVALDHPELVDEHVSAVVAERERLFTALEAMSGVTVAPSVTNFLLFAVDDSYAAYVGLRERGVLVRRQEGPRLGAYLRVSIGRPEENDLFLEALAGVLGQEKTRG